MASIPTKVQRSMRIISLPLANPRLKQGVSSQLRPNLMYYHFHMDKPEGRSEEGVVKRIIAKTSELWSGFGRKREGSWQRRIYQYGEKLIDRLDFEELALKSIDPSLGPDADGARSDASEDINSNSAMVPLIYPSSIIGLPHSGSSADSNPLALAHLQNLLADRTPRHRKGFYTWAILAPFTIPFALVPLIPNLPFLFCAWRSWSHYRAYRASQYLQCFIANGTIIPHASAELDEVYAAVFSKESLKARQEQETEQELLLSRESIPRIVAMFNLPPSAAVDIHRALEQARARIKKVIAQ